MKFFLLLSVLTLPAATAKTAKELLEHGFELLLSGDYDNYAKYFADGSTLDIDFGAIKWDAQGVNVVGENGFTIPKFLEMFGKLDIYELTYEVYAHPSNPKLGHYDGHGSLRDQNGDRWHIDYICHFGVNDDGIFTFATHRPYSVKKIDAGTLSVALLEDYKRGKIEGLLNNLAPEFCMTTIDGPNHRSYAGKYCGAEGVVEVVTKQAATFDFDMSSDGTANFDIELVSLSNQGKTAVLRIGVVATVKATGATLFETDELVYHVNDKGQFTGNSGRTVSVVELKAGSEKEL